MSHKHTEKLYEEIYLRYSKKRWNQSGSKKGAKGEQENDHIVMTDVHSGKLAKFGNSEFALL